MRQSIPQSGEPFFLPALLPVLGDTPRPSRREPLAPSYPRESAGEPYFMAEGNLAAKGQLSEERAEHITSYRTARLTLLTELRVELDRGPEVDTAVRERARVDLAAMQTPPLLELEAEAEQIRTELTRVQMLKPAAADIGRLVPAREAPSLKDALASVRTLLSAAHFRNGFSPDQRRLLEEMAQELSLTIDPTLGGKGAVFFWPAGARIPAPEGLATGPAEKFAEFQRRKTALKDDLRALLERERKHIFNRDYTDKYEALAAAQAPRFAELDALADELRPALAALAAAKVKPVPRLPAHLTRQVADLADNKAALQREVYARLMEFRRELPDERLELTHRDNGLAIIITTKRGGRGERENALVGIEAFNREVAARTAALIEQRDAVRDALVRYQASQPGAQPGQDVNQLATDSLLAHQANEFLNLQTDYAAAVYATGLSPAQRRLLLASVAVDSVQ